MVEKSEAKLCQSIGPWQVLFYGLGSMLGAGVYVLLGRAAGLLGNAVWLAFLVAMVANHTAFPNRPAARPSKT